MVTGGGGARGGDGKTLGHGGLSPYLIPFLSTPPRSPDSGGPTLCTGGGGRPAAANVRGSRRSPRGLRWWRGWLGGRRTPGGSAGLCRGGTGITWNCVTALQPSVRPPLSLSPRVDLVPAVWRLILVVNFALFGLSTRGDWSLTCVSSRGLLLCMPPCRWWSTFCPLFW